MDRDFFIGTTSVQGSVYHAGMLFLNGAGFWAGSMNKACLRINKSKLITQIGFSITLIKTTCHYYLNAEKITGGYYLMLIQTCCCNYFTIMKITGYYYFFYGKIR
ncbi:hypothetical protein, partial [Edwardsiella ictaluri]